MTDIRPQSSSPETRVAKSYRTDWKDEGVVYSVPEWGDLLKGPGKGINLSSGKRFSAVRDSLETSVVPHQGIHYQKGEAPRVEDVPNPDAPDGRWDPSAYMPRFVFGPEEDAFPVDPAFDGDTNLDNNGPATANGAPGSYKDGVIGGKQGLSGGFAVSKKGEYTILTYSFYYAHNKALHYHPSDYSTAQVYLKPGADGKLQPTHLFTSWHHGGVLTPWHELAKDDAGRPVVAVNRGSHALQPLGRGDEIPKQGLALRGDGVAELNGRELGHRLSFQSFQTNVIGATLLDPIAKESRPRLEAMRWGDAALNPFLPEVFDTHSAPLLELANRYIVSPAKAAAAWAGKQLERLLFIG